jgi:hypothetical protein
MSPKIENSWVDPLPMGEVRTNFETRGLIEDSYKERVGRKLLWLSEN